MGDENPIRALGDYSKPSHEGYRNTIELLDRNNVVPLRSDTIWLVQNGCSFHGLWSEDPNQHLKDFLKLGSISTWEDLTTHFLAQFFPSGRTVKLQNDILMLQQYQGKLKEEIMMEENKVKKIKKITRYPDTEDLEPLNDYKFLETLMKKESFHTPKSAPASSLYVRYVHLIFLNPPLVRKSTFVFKPSKKGSQSVRSRHDVGNSLTSHSTPYNYLTFGYDYPINGKILSNYFFTINKSNRVFDLGEKDTKLL
ncbi:zinc finger, CCHC-type containing protein [Tanacetum coccineum]